MTKRVGASLREINIRRSVTSHFEDIGQDMENHDVTYENGQARERTQILMDVANQVGGMAVGTGDKMCIRDRLFLGFPLREQSWIVVIRPVF